MGYPPSGHTVQHRKRKTNEKRYKIRKKKKERQGKMASEKKVIPESNCRPYRTVENCLGYYNHIGTWTS